MTNRKIKVGVIFGGRSGEHEVSIVSAESVMKALDKEKYEVVPIGISKEGAWIAGPEAVPKLIEGAGDMPFRSLLPADPTNNALITDSKEGVRLVEGIDVIFPVVHGTYGEDGTLQGLIELANIPYVGSGVLGSAASMDKIVQKQICHESGIPIVPYTWLPSYEWQEDQEAVLNNIEHLLKYPVFTKPANLGSSVGIGKCHNREELAAGINEALKYDHKVIVEQGIEDIHEIEIGVLGNENPQASVPGEIVSSNDFYDYDAKYVDGKSEERIPAPLPEDVIKVIQDLAKKSFVTMNCSGMARIDFLVTKNEHKIYLNEINTIPGFTSISMYPKLWEASGVSYPDLLDRLIKLAIERHRQKNKLQTSFEPKSDWHKG